MAEELHPPPPPAVIVRSTPPELAIAAASWLAAALREAIGRRGSATLAVSGGSTPGLLFRALADEHVAWDDVHVLQVDERIAPDGHLDRNLTELRATLLDVVPLPAAHFHPMPVAALLDATPLPSTAAPSTHPSASDPSTEAKANAAAADAYAAVIEQLCGGIIDVVHLGLGDDGHTASLLPGDPALDAADVDVAVTKEYRGRRRMTLTYPVLDRAGVVLWLVAGAGKSEMLPRLVAHDPTIPAGRVHNDNAVLFADIAAAAHLTDVTP